MAKQQSYIQGLAVLKLLSDENWVTILSALIRDSEQRGRKLAGSLLQTTKQGRHIRMLQHLMKKPSTVPELQKQFKISRRSVFRDLQGLESYGTVFRISSGWKYEVHKIPDLMAPLMGKASRAK